MASNALLRWQTDRLPRLNDVDVQCVGTLAIAPPPVLADENLRGYVMLLSAHFQGFCRDLHTECVQAVATSVIPAMQPMIQAQCVAGRELDAANPRFETLRKDFDRFGLDLKAALTVNPANALRIANIGHLNLWRNYAAHHKSSMPMTAGSLIIGNLRMWKNSCDGLATEFDGIMYNHLQTTLGAPPW